MKKILNIFILIFLLLFAGCGKDSNQENENNAELKKYESISKSMSQNTSLSQSSIEEISIKIETAVYRACEKTIRNAVNKLDGIIESDVDINKKTAVIKYDSKLVDPAAIRTAISNVGYDADDVKRNEKAYNNLEECCKIETGAHG